MLLDFGPIYTNTGNLLQLDYSKKAVGLGSTCIGFRYNDGIIIAAENPIDSPLYKVPTRIQELGPNIFSVSTGLLSDSIFITETIKKNIHDQSLELDTLINFQTYKRIISNLVSLFTKYYSTRPVGCAFMTAVYDESFHLLTTEPSSLTQECVGYTIGKGMQRGNTEIEKLNTDNLDLKQAMEHVVRILYKSYDPLKDKNFSVEICYMDRESKGKMVRVDENEVSEIVEMYKDLSIDE